MATKDVNTPDKLNNLLPRNLSQLNSQRNQKRDAINLIKSLLGQKNPQFFQPSKVNELLFHPFFTVDVEQARDLLHDSRFCNVEELQKWYDALDENEKSKEFDQDSFKDLKEIVSTNQSIPVVIADAFEHYPELFSKFIWDLSRKYSQSLTFIKEREIGRGSFGIVYAGKWIDNLGTKTPAACKTLTNEESKKEFDKEVQALKDLDHLFVIKFLGACEIESKNCIVMELCEGTLEKYVLQGLERIPKQSLDDKVLLGQVTLGLAYIHSKRMIHKDLKPANILLWKQSLQSTLVLAKIADFGYAKQLKVGQIDFSETDHPGTKSYMAPELLRKQDTEEKFMATYASDAYSLGITIAFTVNKGQHPYGNTKIFQPLLMVSGFDPIQIGELEWDVIDLILKLTKEEPNERPSVGIVIYHPYFSLTNENTKAHFHEKIGGYFEHFRPWKTNKYFTKSNIEKWIATVKEPKNNEKNIEMLKVFEQIKNENVRDVLSQIEKMSANYSKIEEAITQKSQTEIKDISFRRKFTVSDLIRNLISTSIPQLVTTYIWHLLSNGINDSFPVASFDQIDELKHLQVIERAFGCLYNTIEEYKEISNLKRGIQKPENKKSIYQFIDDLPLYAVPEDELIEISKCLNNKDNVGKEDETYYLLCSILNHRWYGKHTLIKAILENGANPNQHCSSLKERTAVHLAAENESNEGLEILKTIMENKGNPNAQDVWQRTPLHCAAENESNDAVEMVKLLLQGGGNPDAVDDWKRTSLHCAAQNESYAALEMVKLLENNKNRNAVDKNKRTPLHLAARNKSSTAIEILKLLLIENKISAVSTDIWERTPLHWAAQNKSSASFEMVNLLLVSQGNPNAKDKRKRTPVHLAVMNTSSTASEILAILLKNGGNPNAVDFKNRSPVHLAVEKELNTGPKILKRLLKNRGNPNAVDRDIRTPVHLTVQNESSTASEILAILLENKGNPNAIDRDNRTPVHLAVQNESSTASEILAILFKNGGNPNAVDRDNRTPVHLAVQNESSTASEILAILLKNGGNPNAVDRFKRTPVHFAVQNKSSKATEILKVLLKYGGNPNAVDTDNQSPIPSTAQNE